MARTDKQTELIELALSQVGVQENSPNDGPVIRMFQRVIGKPEKEPWCVSFVQWCVRQVDREFESKTLLFPTESSQILWTKTPTIARVDFPEPGNIVVWTKFQNDLPTSIGHVGIVTSIIDNEFMETVEGNTSPIDGIQREGDGVYVKRRHIKVSTGLIRIAGFLRCWAD